MHARSAASRTGMSGVRAAVPGRRGVRALPVASTGVRRNGRGLRLCLSGRPADPCVQVPGSTGARRVVGRRAACRAHAPRASRSRPAGRLAAIGRATARARLQPGGGNRARPRRAQWRSTAVGRRAAHRRRAAAGDAAVDGAREQRARRVCLRPRTGRTARRRHRRRDDDRRFAFRTCADASRRRCGKRGELGRRADAAAPALTLANVAAS